MPKKCFEYFIKSHPELHAFLKERSGVDFNGENEGREKYIQAIKELQDKTLTSLNNVYADIGVEGYKNISSPKTKTDAVQKQSTGEVLQRQQGEVGEPGSERERVEPEQQGQEPAGESAPAKKEEVTQETGTDKKVPPSEVSPSSKGNEDVNELMDAADNRLVDAIIHRVSIKGMSFDKALDDAIKSNRKDFDEGRKDNVIKKAKEELSNLNVGFDEQLEKEISNYKLDTPIGLKKYKDQLSSHKRSLTQFQKEPKKYSDEIKLQEEVIGNMQSVLDYFGDKTKAEKSTTFSKSFLQQSGNFYKTEEKSTPLPTVEQVNKTVNKTKKNEPDINSKKQTPEGDIKQGGVEGSQSDKQEKVRTLKKRAKPTIKNPVYLKALESDANDPTSQVLKYFVNGGRINDEALQQLYGSTNRGTKENKNIQGELNAKISLRGKDAPKTLDALAHELWDNSPEEVQARFSTQDFRDAVEQVLLDHNHRTSMAEELAKGNFTPEDKEMADWYEQTYGSAPELEMVDKDQTTDYLEGLSDAEIEKLDGLNEAALNDADFVNELAAKYPSETQNLFQIRSRANDNEQLKSARSDYEKALRDLSKVEDKLSQKQATQTGMFGEAAQGEMFGVNRDEAKSILDPLRQKVKETKAAFDQAQKTAIEEATGQQSLFQVRGDLPNELLGETQTGSTGFGGNREHTIGKVNLEDLKVLDNGIETAKNTFKTDKSFKPTTEPIIVGVDINTGEKQLLDGYHRYISKDGKGEVSAKFIPMKDGNVISFEEAKNLFSIKETGNDQLEAGAAVIKDYMDKGYSDLKLIQDSVAKQLGDTSPELRQQVKEAFDYYHKKYIPEEIHTAIVNRVKETFGKLLGSGVRVYKNQAEVMKAAGQYSNPQFNNFQIIGEKAKLNQTVRDNLSVARGMENAGKNSKEIYLATGWERGADKKWRYEIDDRVMDLSKFERVGDHNKTAFNAKLEDVYNNPELYKLYPSLKNINVVIDSKMPFRNGEWDKDLHQIKMGGDLEAINPKDYETVFQLNSVLGHEIQHAVQDIEGFAKGGNFKTVAEPSEEVMEKIWAQYDPQAFEIMKKYDIGGDYLGEKPPVWFKDRLQELRNANASFKDIRIFQDIIDKGEREAYRLWNLNTAGNAYHKLAGEVEARNVQFRSMYTPEERERTPFSETEDVHRDDQIKYFDDNEAQHAANVINKHTEDFYSPLEKFLENNPQQVFTQEQVLGQIKNLPQQEIEWIGLKDFMKATVGADGRGKNLFGKITKNELLDYVRENKVNVEVVTKSDQKDLTGRELLLKDKHDTAQRVITEMQDKFAGGNKIYVGGKNLDWGYKNKDGEFTILTKEQQEKLDKAQEDISNYQDVLTNDDDSFPSDYKQTKFGQYTLPGEKSNYREVLLTLPTKEPAYINNIIKDAVYERGDWVVRMNDGAKFSVPEAANAEHAKEIVQGRFDSGVYGKADRFKNKNVFVSSHFDEPNIIAHIRLTDRTTPDGKRILFVEESQSDWAREGRKHGFVTKERENLLKRLEDLRQQRKASMKMLEDTSRADWMELNAKDDKISDEIESIKEFMEAKNYDSDAVPDLPFKNDKWVELATKKAIQLAAQEGYDGVAWINGNQTADRYSLDKQVKELRVDKDGEIFGYDHSNVLTFQKQIEGGKTLADYVGKEIAERIENTEPDAKGARTLKDQDLKIDAKWARNLYDKQIPKLAEKYAKQYGGKVTEFGIKTKGDGEYEVAKTTEDIKKFSKGGYRFTFNGDEISKQKAYEIIERGAQVEAWTNEDSKQFGIEINQKVKEKTESLPMFMKTPEGDVMGFTAPDGSIHLNGEKYNGNTPVHEAGHLWLKWSEKYRPDIHKTGMDLTNNSVYLKNVKRDKNYIEQADAAGLTGTAREDFFRNEALASAIGDKGEQFVTGARKQNFKEWLNTLWRDIKAHFGIRDLTPKQLQELTLDEFSKKAAADILSGKELETPAKPKFKVAARTEVLGEKPPEPPKAAPEPVTTEPERIGIAHARLDEVAKELGLPVYEKDPVTVQEWNEEADKRIANGEIPALLSKLEDEDLPTAAEQRMLAKYAAGLKADYNVTKSDAVLNEFRRVQQLSNIVAGRLLGQSMRARQEDAPVHPLDGGILSAMAAKMDARQTDALTDLQKAEVEQLVKNYEERIKVAEEKVTSMEAKMAEIAASKTLRSMGRKTASDKPKTPDDYVKERQSLKEKLRFQIEEINKKPSDEKPPEGTTGAPQNLYQIRSYSSTPTPEEIKVTNKIAKTIGEIIKSHVEEVGSNLPEVTRRVLDEIKDVLPDVEAKDIHDIIDGKYNPPRKTLTQLQVDMRDLNTEVELLNEIINVENGVPKTERQEQKKNERLTELRTKLKELKKDKADDEKVPKSNSQRLDDAKKRVNESIEKIREEIITKERELHEKLKPLNEDLELARLKEQEASLKDLRDKYLPLEPDIYEIPKERERIKDGLVDSIIKINEQINAGEKNVTVKNKFEHDAELNKLRKIKAQKTEILNLLDPRAAEQAKLKQAQRTEADLLDKIAEIKAGIPKTEKEKTEKDARLEDLRKQLKDLKKEVGYDDLTKLKALKTANENKLRQINEDIANKNFDRIKPLSIFDNKDLQRRFPEEYKAALDAIKAREDAKHDFDIAVLRDQQSKQKGLEKFTSVLSKTSGTAKAIVTGIDDSGVAIQTYVSLLIRPGVGAQALREHLLQGASQKKFDRWLTELHNSKDWELIKKSGLSVTEPSSLKELEKEEIFANRFHGTVKIKGKEYKLLDVPLKPFERAFTTLGNVSRVVAFKNISAKYLNEGKTFESHPELFKSLAARLNTETGRGAENEFIRNAAKIVTIGIWSPKLMASKFNILGISDIASLFVPGTKGYYRQMHPRERVAAILDVAQFVGTVVALSYLGAYAFGADVDDDPLSPTFMDIKFKNGKSVNLTGGFSGYFRSIYQVARGKKLNLQTGKVEDVSRLALIGRFFRGKVPPLTGAILNTAEGKNFMGQKTTLLDEAKNTLLPISAKGIVDQIVNDGSGAFLTGLPTFLGFNVKDAKDFQKLDNLTEEERKDPTYKTFIDKGIAFPDYDPEKIQTKEVNGKIVEHLKDLPQPAQEKYITTHKRYYKEELGKLKNNVYKVYRDESGAVHIQGENTSEKGMKRVPFKDLTNDEVKYLESNLTGRATRRTKKVLHYSE